MLLEHERHVQLSTLAAQNAAKGFGQGDVQKMQHQLNKQHDRQLKMALLRLPELLAHRQPGGSVDDVVRLYNMIEDQLDQLVAAT